MDINYVAKGVFMSASLTRHTKFECLCEHEYRNPSLNKKEGMQREDILEVSLKISIFMITFDYQCSVTVLYLFCQ